MGLFTRKTSDGSRVGRITGRPGSSAWRDTRIPDEDYGGDHSMGTGTYEAKTPEQARALYAQLPRGSAADAGPEPPKSPSGRNWYTDEEMAEWDAAGRPQNHDYLRQSSGGGWGRGGGW